MNQAICDYGRTNKINSMGTTAALLAFAEDAVYSCNLGDSRIYKSDREKFCQISQDHVLGRSLFGKAPLTQYLGMEEENLQLEPSISRQEIKIGDRFLLCSDGITDMLSDGEIADILSREYSSGKNRRDSRGQSSEKVEEIILQLFYVRSWSSHAICSDEC